MPMKTLCAALLGLTFLLHAHAASPAASLVVEQDHARILALAEKALFMPPDSLTRHPSPLTPGFQAATNQLAGMPHHSIINPVR